MTNRSTAIVAVLVAVALAGCKSQEPPPPMKCGEIIPEAVDRIMADHAEDPRVVAVIDKAKQEMVSACTTDKWSDRAGKCIADAKDRAAMDQCRGALTDKQRERLEGVNARLRGAIEQSGAEAGSGSAAGSAK